uniref:Uncharacterized protein n=1 Tax=Buteo japonicus TaxID=224669 RepID=A0A8B9Z050_9AVES
AWGGENPASQPVGCGASLEPVSLATRHGASQSESIQGMEHPGHGAFQAWNIPGIEHPGHGASQARSIPGMEHPSHRASHIPSMEHPKHELSKPTSIKPLRLSGSEHSRPGGTSDTYRETLCCLGREGHILILPLPGQEPCRSPFPPGVPAAGTALPHPYLSILHRLSFDVFPSVARFRFHLEID